MAATARKVEDLAVLQEQFPGKVRAFALDLTNPASIRTAVAAAHEELGHLDVIISNAGRGLLGALEDLPEEQIRQNIDVNLFGLIRLVRAVLPILRAQHSGTIVNISALAALANHPGFTVYGGAKAGMEAVCDGLHAELAPFGIKILSVEPGPFRTDFIRRSLDQPVPAQNGYTATVGKFSNLLKSIDGKQAGDPEKAAEAIFQAVESPNPPSRLLLGRYAYKTARQRLEQLTRDMDDWEPVGATTDFS